MGHLFAVLHSKLLSPILLTALLPLSFRYSATGTQFLFLGGGKSMIAITLWTVCVTLTVVAIAKSRRHALRAQG